jgi:hypothetical protein
VARELTELIGVRGKPGIIVSDNGTEFTSNAILGWAKDHRVEWHYWPAPGFVDTRLSESSPLFELHRA